MSLVFNPRSRIVSKIYGVLSRNNSRDTTAWSKEDGSHSVTGGNVQRGQPNVHNPSKHVFRQAIVIRAKLGASSSWIAIE